MPMAPSLEERIAFETAFGTALTLPRPRAAALRPPEPAAPPEATELGAEETTDPASDWTCMSTIGRIFKQLNHVWQTR